MTERPDYRLHQDVVWVLRPDGSSHLLHMGGSICAIDEPSTRLLKSVVETGVDHSVGELASRYGVAEDVVRGDVRTFIEDLRRERILCHVSERGTWAERGADVAARALLSGALGVVAFLAGDRRIKVWGLLWTAKWMVAQFGWARALREWQRRYPQPTTDRPACDEELEEIDRSVRATGARSWISVECKERALACLAFAREKGIPAQLIVGVTHYPLQGHVWVESHGRVVSDAPEHCQRFEPIARYG